MCPLCGEIKKIILSHILPEGFYRKIYDEGRALFYSESRNTSQKIQQGFKQRLLCEDCDNKVIGSHDKYAIEVIRDKRRIDFREEKGVHIWSEINTQKIKMFFASLLFRAHLSNRPPYESISLDEDLIERIKSYILGMDGAKNDFFQIFSLALVSPDDGALMEGVITPIHSYYLSGSCGRRAYAIVFSGFCWYILVGDKIENHPQEKFFLSQSGRMISPRINAFECEPLKVGFKSMINMRNK